jgi:hypothetical protein
MNTYRSSLGAFVALALMAVLGSFSSPGLAQTRGGPEQFSANFVDINSGRTGPIQISVTRWSTESERKALLGTLFKEGQDGLLEALRDMRSVGRIHTPGSIGYDLRYSEARKLPDGGREIILATDRPMSFREIVERPISAQYPFTWVQFKMRPDGTGEGKLAVAARIIGEEADQLIEVQDFAISPVRLQNIRSTKGDN